MSFYLEPIGHVTTNFGQECHHQSSTHDGKSYALESKKAMYFLRHGIIIYDKYLFWAQLAWIRLLVVVGAMFP